MLTFLLALAVARAAEEGPESQKALERFLIGLFIILGSLLILLVLFCS